VQMASRMASYQAANPIHGKNVEGINANYFY